MYNKPSYIEILKIRSTAYKKNSAFTENERNRKLKKNCFWLSLLAQVVKIRFVKYQKIDSG